MTAIRFFTDEDFTYSPRPAGADHYVLARVAGSDDVAATAEPLRVVNPSVELSATVARSGGGAGAPLTRGGRSSVVVTVLNAGTDRAAGPLALSLFAVPEGADPVAGGTRTELALVTRPMRLNAGRARAVKLTFTLPATLAAGRYTLAVLIDAANAFAEEDEGDNTAAATSPLIAL